MKSPKRHGGGVMNRLNLESGDMDKIREEFPITKEFIYFNHGGTGPISLSGVRAVDECINTYLHQAEFDIEEYFRRVDRARSMAAEFIGALPDEITFTHNTSEGIYIALINLPLKEDDEILVMEESFPAVRYVVNHNLPYCRKVYAPFSRRDPLDVVKENFNSRLKAVVVDFVQYLSGEMIEIKRLGDFLKERGIFFVVDAIQALGAVAFNIRDCHVDFLACGAGKWLFGPTGAGFLYVNKESVPLLKKRHVGWLGAQWRSFNDCQKAPPLYPDARMFELGSRNIIGISALSANMNLLLGYGLENVARRISMLKSELRKRFTARGCEILTPEAGFQSGILTVRPREDSRAVYERLKENKVIVSLRSGYLRFSPHFYNTVEEIEKIFEVI
ncbi:MAG TPA: aminotransferase class V-fold PLP-dependent enzyme [candidate division WOR-3 bacterium]|uniref:Aminotransferase class V-fold PLP-dependent enzyme n=1 Tax=candidate division WOR-3 bacterium TaxID=2052148 RepID=A0A9C9K028_UNCW3|nr:aminotransferase class V-fold PLP-dependent enzyme [candidate division WOR-3 bacterium]